MAGDGGDREGRAERGEMDVEATHEPRECMACRGTGRVISNLGGTTSRVTCPWCDGGGVRVPGLDAQARWRGSDGSEQQAAPETGQPGEPGA